MLTMIVAQKSRCLRRRVLKLAKVAIRFPNPCATTLRCSSIPPNPEHATPLAGPLDMEPQACTRMRQALQGKLVCIYNFPKVDLFHPNPTGLLTANSYFALHLSLLDHR